MAATLPAKEPALDKLVLPAFLDIDDDGEEKYIRMASGKIYSAVVAGKPVLKARGPRDGVLPSGRPWGWLVRSRS